MSLDPAILSSLGRRIGSIKLFPEDPVADAATQHRDGNLIKDHSLSIIPRCLSVLIERVTLMKRTQSAKLYLGDVSQNTFRHSQVKFRCMDAVER